MRLNEIYRNNIYRGSSSELQAYEKELIRFQKKKLKGMYVGIIKKTGGAMSIGLYDPKDVESNKTRIRPYVDIYMIKIQHYWSTDHTVARNTVRGTGLGFQLYLYMLKELRIPLVSGESQTAGGRAMWYKLAQYSEKDPKLSVYKWDPNKSTKQFVAVQPSENRPGELEAEDDSMIYRGYGDQINDDDLNSLYDDLEYLKGERVDILAKYNFNINNREFKQEAKPVIDKIQKLKSQIKKLEYKLNRDLAAAENVRIVAVYDPKTEPNTEIGWN